MKARGPLATAFVVAAAAGAVVGVAHTKAARPLLARGGCPFGYDEAPSEARRHAAARAFARSHAGVARALGRPALAFELGATTRDEVTAWASAHRVACSARSRIECEDVPDAALPEAMRGAPVKSLWLSFDGAGALASAVVVRRSPDAAALAETFRAAKATLEGRVGPVTETTGEASDDYLRKGLLYQASAEYRFRDYYAVLRATNMGDGFALTEDYRALSD